jgi:hypothetical protein
MSGASSNERPTSGTENDNAALLFRDLRYLSAAALRNRSEPALLQQATLPVFHARP